MVVFVDLDHDAFKQRQLAQGPEALVHGYIKSEKPSISKLDSAGLPSRPASPLLRDNHVGNSNRNAFSAALSCYPYGIHSWTL